MVDDLVMSQSSCGDVNGKDQWFNVRSATVWSVFELSMAEISSSFAFWCMCGGTVRELRIVGVRVEHEDAFHEFAVGLFFGVVKQDSGIKTAIGMPLFRIGAHTIVTVISSGAGSLGFRIR